MAELADFSYALRGVRVVFGDGALSRMAEVIDPLPASRFMLVSTPGRGSAVETAQAALGSRAVARFDRARLHVPRGVVTEALGVLEESRADCIVAIGGGSAVGLGKALVRETGLPLVAVPTTYAGSEMTDIWGVTDGSRKETGRDPRVAPTLVVYDPDLTHGLPPEITGPSGMNAIAHAVEALNSSTASPVSSLLAADGVRRLARSLPVLVGQPDHRAARRDALCGAHFCGCALDLTTMGLHHKLCHVLGGTLDLPHALTHAVVLPYVTAYNAVAAPDAMRTLAGALGAQDAADGLWQLNQTLGIAQSLSDVGLREADVDRIAELATREPYPNPAPVTRDAVRQILTRSLAGGPPAGGSFTPSFTNC